jgi:hypothetical protein
MSSKETHCPVCYEKLEIVEVAPCDDCGWREIEIQHFKEKKHIYAKFEVYGSKLILCNFCDVDFSSFHPSFWGFSAKEKIGYGSKDFHKIEEIPYEKLGIGKDKFCPFCYARLTFLRALVKTRENNLEDNNL